MKKIIVLACSMIVYFISNAQEDTTSVEVNISNIHVKVHKSDKKDSSYVEISAEPKNKKQKRLQTNWGIVDIGFNGFTDKSNYNSSAIQDANTGLAPGFVKSDFRLRTGKSTNVNVWIVMQKLRVVQSMYLKYGIGLEMYNFNFSDHHVTYEKNSPPYFYKASDEFKKNKLAMNYITIPFSVNFDFMPERKKDYGFGVGLSVGYLYNSHLKLKNVGGQKDKIHDSFDFDPLKVSAIGEISLGIFKLYGSFTLNHLNKTGLDFQPFAIGFRLSSF